MPGSISEFVGKSSQPEMSTNNSINIETIIGSPLIHYIHILK